MKLGAIWNLIRETFSEWSEDKAPRLAAALAYYTVFSLAPLLVIAISIAGIVFGRDAARNQILKEVGGLIGTESVPAIEAMVSGASKGGESIAATIAGVVLLLFGASGVFGQLQDSLNTIWEVKVKPNAGIMRLIRDRFFSFTVVVGTGFLLLVSLIISAALSALGTYFSNLLPGWEIVFQIANMVVSFLVIAFLFALIFKYMPDAVIAWKDVWPGAFVTSFLFIVGQILIELYISKSDFQSSYGIAGSLIVILLWVYYSAQIVLLGAEFTQVYANLYGSKIVPDEKAISVTEEERAQQGITRKEPGGAGLAQQGKAAQRKSSAGAGVAYSPGGSGRAVATPAGRKPDLLPPAEPSLLTFFTIVGTLAGFLGGTLFRSRNSQVRRSKHKEE